MKPTINPMAARGVFLSLIALYFLVLVPGLTIGRLNQPGLGLFPFVIGWLLMVIALAVLIRARFASVIPIDIQFKNVGLIVASLVAFVMVTKRVNMLAGIAIMITIALLASYSCSAKRNIVIAASHCAVGYAMKKFIGVQLPLL